MTKAEQFKQYDSRHPEVYETLLAMCQTIRDKGFKKYGISPLIEVIRWNLNIQRGPGEEFKIQNDFKPWYARKIVAENPEYAEFFEFRVMRAE